MKGNVRIKKVVAFTDTHDQKLIYIYIYIYMKYVHDGSESIYIEFVCFLVQEA